MTRRISSLKFVGLLLVLAMLLTACVGNAPSNQDTSVEDTAVPTKTLFPTYEYVAPATANVFGQSESTAEANSETDVAIELDPQLVERGLGRYEALECGICHGVNGEGTDDIIGLDNLSLSQDAFVTFMRSGGTIGNSHQYSTNRLSNNGATNLYQYLVSLAQGE